MEMLSLLSRLHYIEFGACRLDSVNIPGNFNILLKAVICHSLLRLSKLTGAVILKNRNKCSPFLSVSPPSQVCESHKRCLKYPQSQIHVFKEVGEEIKRKGKVGY